MITEININVFLLPKFSSSAGKDRLLQGALMNKSLTGDSFGVFNAKGKSLDAPSFHPSSQ